MNDRRRWLGCHGPARVPRSLGWGIPVALGVIACVTAFVLFLVSAAPDRRNPGVLVALALALIAAVLLARARLRAAESEERRREAAALAGRQSALRKVATLVAAGTEPSDVFLVAVTELARGLDVEHVTLTTFEGGDRNRSGGDPVHCVVLAAHDASGSDRLVVGERLLLDGDSINARVRRTGAPARIDDYHGVEGPVAERMRGAGLRGGVGCPITVNGEARGALIVGSVRETPMSSETEDRIGDFADLIAMAIGNAENRAELQASRARIVAAADQARQGIERDLRDGAQQRIASLGLGLRALEASLPDDDTPVRAQVDNLIHGMADLYTELQELTRGIHPAILSKGGIGPAVKALARRSPVPVALELATDRRFPESVELAAYYVVAEALTNVAEHAGASEVAIRVLLVGEDLQLDIADNGSGGAISGAGSGLLGLKDRVEAVSGTLVVTGEAGAGTTVSARIPG